MLLIGFSVTAQRPTDLEGRVYSENNDVAGTHVMNITTQRATVTDANGFFIITVRLNDTLVFSAVQFKRKVIPVTLKVLESKLVYVPLDDVLTQLDEVVVMPYNLTGELSKDMGNLEIEPVVTASTLCLPNANVVPITQSQRKLYTARTWNFKGTKVTIDPIFNYFSGRTKMLKNRVARDKKYARTQRVREFYTDSVYRNDLRIPETKIDNFMYFCEADSLFDIISNTNDKLRMWEFLQKKSVVYRKNRIEKREKRIEKRE